MNFQLVTRPVLPTIKGLAERKSDPRTGGSGSGESYVPCLCATWLSREPLEVSSTTASLAINQWTSGPGVKLGDWISPSKRIQERNVNTHLMRQKQTDLEPCSKKDHLRNIWRSGSYLA